MLEDLLEYHQKPEDSAFVTKVMEGVERQKKVRRMVLATTGVVGAAFGAAGAILLSGPLAQAMGEANIVSVSTAVVAGLAFLAWIFQDEMSANS